MKDYMNILVAVELVRAVDEKIINEFLDMAKDGSINLHLVHIIEHAYTPTLFLDSRRKYEAYIRREMSELGADFDIPERNQFVIVGNIDKEIVDLLKIIDADLLVVGNHGRHGVQSLFHSNHTASLVKSADCDMLAVKVA